MLLLLPTRTPAKRRNWHGRISDRRGQLTQSSDAIDGRIFRRATQLTRSHLGLSSSIRISYRVTQHGRISPSSSSIDALHFQIADSNTDTDPIGTRWRDTDRRSLDAPCSPRGQTLSTRQSTPPEICLDSSVSLRVSLGCDIRVVGVIDGLLVRGRPDQS